ncbi:phage portal protein [Nitrospirillum bahiense]|uniref:Lambda family phage portal protein n=1 Tax=Nitrospirillum amazonense TaxID=28077 RepID=A0A560F1W8_9PROT|nr:phage portal protein [Nitrospirillum amazonense]TWB15604.1 lambda family phage portal protein [Nitrospirillum amazonense]
MAFPFVDRIRGAAIGWSVAANRNQSRFRGAAIGYRAAGERAQARVSLEAGQRGRRLSTFLPSRQHVNTLIATSGDTVLGRARYLARNNAYARAGVRGWANSAVGDGIQPSSLIADDAQRTAVMELFKEWLTEADSEGISDFYGLQRRVAQDGFIAGEMFIRRRPRLLSDGLSVPLQLQLLPSEMCPLNWTMPYNGNYIRQGIEFNAIGQRVAYWFYRTHPGDVTEPPSNADLLTRVPASEIIHVVDPMEGGQLRGLSSLASVIPKLWLLDSYDDAELERKRVAAMFSVFLEMEDPDGSLDDVIKVAIERDGLPTSDIEPGMLRSLLPGQKPWVANPADVGGNYEAFQYRNLLSTAIGMGIPYFILTGDLRQMNYSSMRGALLDFRRAVRAFQNSVIAFQMLDQIWAWFLDAAVLAGKLDLPGYAANPRPYRRVKWIAPRFDWVDPVKDTQADILAVNARFKSRSDVIEERGDDPEQVDRRIQADAAREKKLGLDPAPAVSTRPSLTGEDTSEEELEPGADQQKEAA